LQGEDKVRKKEMERKMPCGVGGVLPVDVSRTEEESSHDAEHRMTLDPEVALLVAPGGI
jgi:hypothetical protein